MHSHNYRTPEPFKGLNVAILGAGQSGRDISQELCSVSSSVHLSHGADFINIAPLKECTPIVDVTSQGRLVTRKGEELAVDVLIYATGYHFDFPFLKSSDAGLTVCPPKRIKGLYRHLLSIEKPTIAFIGLPIKVNDFFLHLL